jgi:predicted Rdx family selenoprotein
VASHLQEELGLVAELVVGDRGEFSVRVNGRVVIQKKADRFPTPDQCVDAVEQSLM